MKGYIYRIINNVNGKVYIGQHNGKNPNYWASGKAINRAKEIYGEQSFVRTILRYCSTQEQLDYWEKWFITDYDCCNTEHGYNLDKGGFSGCLGYKHTQKSKNKISVGNKGKVRTTAMKEHNRQKHLGKVASDETKLKMSLKCKGKLNHEWKGSIQAIKNGIVIAEFEDWESIKSFLGKSNKAVNANVNSCTKGKLKTAYGYEWKRINTKLFDI